MSSYSDMHHSEFGPADTYFWVLFLNNMHYLMYIHFQFRFAIMGNTIIALLIVMTMDAGLCMMIKL